MISALVQGVFLGTNNFGFIIYIYIFFIKIHILDKYSNIFIFCLSAQHPGVLLCCRGSSGNAAGKLNFRFTNPI